MVHLPEIIQDLALILAIAGVVTLLFRRIRQPVVLGYIIAGVLVSQHTPFFPTVTDLPNVKVWAEIGVIFLLFALGLEFSFKKLVRVGGAASLTGFVEVVGMMGIGFLVGHMLGWKWMDNLFLGGILAISSTTIIIRAFEELGVKTRGFVNLVFGVLIFEDLIAIVMLALLSTIAVSKELQGFELAESVFRLTFFLLLWFLTGIFILPTVIRRAKKYLSDETVLIGSIGLCFAMVVAAVQVGFSAALGAFVMGSILAETTEAERIEHLIKPVKDLFAAVFFVSVGMLINPSLLFEHVEAILLITVVTIIGKIMTTMLGALLAGQSPRHSVQAGFSLAQIGEFSFIIAVLGESLKVTSDFLYPVAVGVSVITTFTTPYLIRSSDKAYALIDRNLPDKWRTALSKYSTSAISISATSGWNQVLKAFFSRIVINAALITAIFLAVSHFAVPVFIEHTDQASTARGFGLFLAILLSAPFFWSLVVGHSPNQEIRKLWRSRRHRAAIVVMESSRILIAIGLFAFLAPRFIAFRTALFLALGLAILTLLVFSRYLGPIYDWFEKRFFENLSERERLANQGLPPVAPWDAHISKIVIPSESQSVAKSLEELKVRERFGVTIAMIERGKRIITAPNRQEMILPHDRISVIGTDEQILSFQRYLEKSAQSTAEPEGSESTDSYMLQAYSVNADSYLVGTSIRNSGIREKTHGLVVGLERDGKRILNPDSTTELRAGDLLWIAGDRTLLRDL